MLCDLDSIKIEMYNDPVSYKSYRKTNECI